VVRHDISKSDCSPYGEYLSVNPLLYEICANCSVPVWFRVVPAENFGFCKGVAFFEWCDCDCCVCVCVCVCVGVWVCVCVCAAGLHFIIATFSSFVSRSPARVSYNTVSPSIN
jgi:hypothetical protein